MLKENITDALIKTGKVSKENLDKALSVQKEKRLPLRRVLVDMGLVSQEDLLSVLSSQLYIPTLHLNKYKFNPDIIGLVPERIARFYTLIPLSRMGNTITIAISDPLNILALDDLSSVTGCSIDIVLSPEDEIQKAIEGQYNLNVKDMQHILDEATAEGAAPSEDSVEFTKQGELDLGSAVEESEKPPIVKIVDLMLVQALKKRASDIHIEPESDCLRIRFRIDGALHDVFKLPKINQNAVLARVKIISNLDITESRLAQDGRFRVVFEDKEVDFRVSALPTTFGQKFVLRALDKSNLTIGLDKLGFAEQPLKVFKEAIAKPFGMILVTGPTGSGKSTTLYSVLSQLNTPERNIMTIEDPVEYQVEGITQVQVKVDVGLTFALGLRSLLRQSPDVIMIGEIRDPETADIAVKAALTGQVVLSTLHTNDAISSITRIIDMGVEPFLAASSIVMLCAQRLCRKVCPHCRKKVDVPASYLKTIGFKFEGKINFYEAAGCKYCNDSGYLGRVAILEAIMMDNNIREMIIRKRSLDEIKRYALEKCGMLTLRDDAFLKVRDEITTLDEAIRITTEE